MRTLYSVRQQTHTQPILRASTHFAGEQLVTSQEGVWRGVLDATNVKKSPPRSIRPCTSPFSAPNRKVVQSRPHQPWPQALAALVNVDHEGFRPSVL